MELKDNRELQSLLAEPGSYDLDYAETNPIYLAGPYSHPDPQVRELRLKFHARAAAHLVNQGRAVFAPLAYTPRLAAAGASPESWYRFDLEFLKFCKAMLILPLPGWRNSSGLLLEVGYARGREIPISRLEDWQQQLQPTAKEMEILQRGA